MNKKYLLLLIIFIFPFSASAQQIGRYITIANKPMLYQTDPLEQTASITFPATVLTIKDAVNYLLENTGYKLIPKPYQSKDADELLGQKLPLSDRKFTSVTIKAALLALAGNTYVLLIDPQRRYISFALKPKFKKLYN